MATAATPITGAIEVVWHYVRDIGATIAWYERVFGLVFRRFDDDWAETTIGDVRFAFHRGDDVRPGTSIVDFRVDNLEAAAATIRERGGEVGDIVRLPHGSYAAVTDPDGYRIELFQRA